MNKQIIPHVILTNMNKETPLIKLQDIVPKIQHCRQGCKAIIQTLGYGPSLFQTLNTLPVIIILYIAVAAQNICKKAEKTSEIIRKPSKK